MNNSRFKITGIMLVIFTTLVSITVIGSDPNIEDADIDDSPLFSLRTAMSTDSGESILKTVKIKYIEPQVSSYDGSGTQLEKVNSGIREPTMGTTCGSTCYSTCNTPTCQSSCGESCKIDCNYCIQHGMSGGGDRDTSSPTCAYSCEGTCFQYTCEQSCYGTCYTLTCQHTYCYETCNAFTMCSSTCLGSTCGSEYTCEGYATCSYGPTCDFGETCFFTCSVKCEITLFMVMQIITGPTFPPGACTAINCF